MWFLDRWVAITLGGKYLFVSVHLPHSRSGISEFSSALDGLKRFLDQFHVKKVFLGMDANVEMAIMEQPGSCRIAKSISTSWFHS